MSLWQFPSLCVLKIKLGPRGWKQFFFKSVRVPYAHVPALAMRKFHIYVSSKDIEIFVSFLATGSHAV